MGKNDKKKTVASSKKVEKKPEQIQPEKKKKNFLKKIFKSDKKGKNNIPESKANISTIETKIDESIALKDSKNSEQNETKNLSKDFKPDSENEEKNNESIEIKKQKAIKKEKKPHTRILKFSETGKQKLKGFVLVVVGLLMIAFVSYFLYTRLFRPESLARFLPADNTIGFIDVNIDGSSDQVKKFSNLFEKYPVYQPSNLIQLLNSVFPVNYQTDLVPWIGREIGIVMMKQTQTDDSVKFVLFVENTDRQKTLNFLKTRALANSGDQLLAENYKGNTIYHYSLGQDYYFTFINNYLVVAGNDALLEQLIDTQNSKNILQNDPVFQKVNDNLPSIGLASGYVNTQKLFDTMLQNPIFQGQNTHELTDLQPFMKIFAAEGFTLVATDNNLTVQQFEAIDRTQLQGQSYLTYNDKYEGQLLNLASEDAILFAGGHDIYKEIERIGEIFSSGTNINNTLFDGILEAQKDKYFGKDISLESDIYPLLQNEYLITVENNFTAPVVSVFMSLSDKNNDMVRIEKLADAFIQQRAIFAPQVQNVTLPDGTKGQEIVASPQEITRSDTQYDGYNLTTLQLGSLPWSINYAVINNTLVISTTPSALESIIDRSDGKIQTNLRASDDFTKTVLPVMGTADEIFNIKLGALIPVFGLDQNPMIKPYVEPFDSLTMAKNFFDDGISTLYVINVL